ncbi:putative MFS family arabinose efflux permease [Krasilnikovia cinnamomea]|uniref:Putative MFS family arabinose efflux permease n=1 Tax=Krasilnikovia cinnamomea TaxID=349313 RepID=A0A4Q7ZEZ3_9ACTN|nr:MFS transporter [Krasilnikovia cinnamomea]RZU49258.1 putative MFS family arabinose efflux permease [Krasilnikovia cinnamomea]
MAAEAAEQRARGIRRAAPLLAATAISVTGDGAFLAAAPLMAATLTRDPLAVSSVTAAVYVPWLVFGLPAGALVDRWHRRRVMITADLFRAAVLAVLVGLLLSGILTLPMLVAAVLLVGVAQCFFDSAAQAVIPTIVGRDKNALAKVNGRYWALDTAGRALVGPPLGSVTFALGRALPFAADSLSFVASAALLRLLPGAPPPAGPHESVAAAIRSGVRHLVGTRDLRALALSMGAYNGAFNMAMAPFVLYATDVLHVANAAYGILLAVSALGGVLAGWQAGPLTRRLSYGQTMAVAHLLQALTWAGIAWSGNAWIATGLLAVLGAGSSLSSVAVGSARQALTPDNLLGRVVAAFRLFGIGAAGIGALIGGAIASHYGTVAPLVAAAVVVLLGSLVTWQVTTQQA